MITKDILLKRYFLRLVGVSALLVYSYFNYSALDSAYGESSRQLTAEEREARKNLVTTLITGTTHALGGDAALANAAATLETENNSAATVTLEGMAVEPISTAALIAGSAGAAAVAVVGGEIYLLKDDLKNSADADAILAGDWSLEQVIAHRGRRCAQAVELQVMSRQLHPHMTLEEKLELQETLSLRNHDVSKRELAELGKKYLPLGFQGLAPLPTILPGRPIEEPGPTLLTTPAVEPQPTVLPGAPIEQNN